MKTHITTPSTWTVTFRGPGEGCIQTNKLKRAMGHHRPFGQQITTARCEDAVRLKLRAERIGGVVARLHASSNRAQCIKGLRELYPGTTLAQIHALGFGEVAPMGWLNMHARIR